MNTKKQNHIQNNIKYSFMTFSCPLLTLDEVIRLAESCGYDMIEPRIEANHRHGIELEASRASRKEIKGKFEKSKIKLSCIATSRRYTDPANVQENIEKTLRNIDLAANVGCNKIRVFGGKIPQGISREEAVENVADALRKVGAYAAEKNIYICMETHDDWCDPVNVAAVMEKVNNPFVRVNWDIMHPVVRCGKTIDESFEVLKPWIMHCHIHDGGKQENLLLPIGQGIVDHKRAMELLIGIGYDGALSGEWSCWDEYPYEKHLPGELATLRRYEKEILGYGINRNVQK